jgi:hypothetical protein
MKLLASHHQFVTDLPPDDQQNDFGIFLLHIIQDPKVPNTEFKLGQGIGPKPADRLRGPVRLISQPRLDRHLKDSLLANRQGSQLCVRIVSNRNVERHPEPSHIGYSTRQTPTARLLVRYGAGKRPAADRPSRDARDRGSDATPRTMAINGSR